MKQTSLRLLLSLLLVNLVACAATHAAESGEAIVKRLENERTAAMVAGDGAALARLFSDEMILVHSDGRVQSKADYIKAMMAGDTAYADAKTSEVQAQQITPDVIVLIGRLDMRKKLGTAWSDLHLRFLSVWRNESGTWRLVSYQSLRPAGSSVVPPKT